MMCPFFLYYDLDSRNSSVYIIRFTLCLKRCMLYFVLGRTLSNIVGTCGPTHLLYDYLVIKYSRLSLSRNPRDSLKYFEISVPRQIRFADLRKFNSNNHI